MDVGVGRRDVTVELRTRDPPGQEREGDRVVVARLAHQAVEVDGPAVEPRGRAGLEPSQLEAERQEAPGEPIGRGVAGAAARGLDLAGVHQRLEEGAGGQDNGPRAIRGAAPATDARDPAPLDQERLDHLLAEGEVLLPFDGLLGQELVGFFVALRPGAVHRRALAPVQKTELDGGRVGEYPHGATQRVDLTNDLPLGHAPDRRVAAHLPGAIAVDRQQRGPATHPRRGQAGLHAGMSRTHDDDVIAVGVVSQSRHI